MEHIDHSEIKLEIDHIAKRIKAIVQKVEELEPKQDNEIDSDNPELT